MPWQEEWTLMNRVYDWPGLAEAGVAVMQRQTQMPQRMEADDSLHY